MSESTLNEFDAAKKIAETLSAVDKDKRVQVLRWAAESAGVTEGIPISAPRQPPVGGAHAEPLGSPVSASAAPDIKTFVNEKKPKNDVQFATVVAYYHCFQAVADARKDTIGPEDLVEATRLTGHQRFNKPGVPLANASTLGYLDRAGGGQFKINAVGENLVAMTLPGNDSEGSPRRVSRKKEGAKVEPRVKKTAKSAG